MKQKEEEEGYGLRQPQLQSLVLLEEDPIAPACRRSPNLLVESPGSAPFRAIILGFVFGFRGAGLSISSRVRAVDSMPRLYARASSSLLRCARVALVEGAVFVGAPV